MTTDPASLHTSPRSSAISREDELILWSQSSPSSPPSHSRGPEKPNPLLAFDPLLQTDVKKKSSTGVWSDVDFTADHPLLGSANTPISTGLPPRIKTKKGHRSHMSLGSAELSGLFKTRGRGHTIAGDVTDEIRHMATTSMVVDPHPHPHPQPPPLANKTKRKPTKNHRKSNSIASMSELVASFGGGGGGSTPATPQMSPNVPHKTKTLSPLRRLSQNSPHKTSKAGITPTPAAGGLQIPLLAKPSPTSLLLTGDDLALRTSEQQPASHQIEIPDVKDMIVHAKLCAFMESYRQIDPTFSMSALVGVPNLALREFAFFGKTNLTTAGLLEKGRPIVKELLECAEGITVEGYAAQNAEVAIFELPKLSQIVGVFRGSDERQAKPVSSKKARQSTSSDVLHPDQKVAVVPAFREAYFELEPCFYTMIDKLTDANPFAKIVLCGHSFGAALATMAAVRYATCRPTMMVSVHAFGSPKVGAVNFRQLVNSISNLKVIRVENKDDPVVNTPTDAANKKWDHVGHTVSIGNKSGVTAYRFEHDKPLPASAPLFRKVERDSKAYVAALESCLSKKQWVKDFAGEDVGDGVLGRNNEKRRMV